MGKITTYLMLLSGVVLLFAFAGLLSEGTLLGTLLDLVNPDTFSTSSFFTKIAAAVTAVAIAGIAIGFLVQGRTDLIMKAALGSLLFGIGWSLLDIHNAIAIMNIWVARLIIAPLLLVYILSVVEWVTGAD